MTTISRDKVVSINYRIYEGDELLEDASTTDGLLFLQGKGNIFSALETTLEGKSVGDEISVVLRPEEGYGFRQNNGIERISIKHLTPRKNLKPGSVVQVRTSHGPRDAVVVKAGKFNVDIDTNHPFAGKTLRFDVSVISIREASAEELAHGHAHGAGGHHH
ncbi:MAG: peptidylprolyl isomerase [Gammaproteobacteria bacterium]|nr:peptidylprolyl isomerase [Gammaproteobacteria bacterium]NKB65414.1 peptidylprolyl isomerase [Gammaproteobacteria bacterium]